MLYIKIIFLFNLAFGQSTMQDLIYEKIERPNNQINNEEISAKKIKKNKEGIISGGNIYFELNKFNITATEHIKLEELAEGLIKIQSKIDRIIIEGFASKDGDPNHNFDLGINRSRAVKDALILLGVKLPIEIYTYGEGSMFQFSNIKKNRRSQIKIILKK